MAMHVQHMQKALIAMDICLPEVHGVSGLALTNAILEGKRDTIKLVFLCHSKYGKTKAKNCEKL
jgi:transposase